MKTTALCTALGLFPSVIKSGEAWTGSCQTALDEANAELSAIRAATSETVFDVPEVVLNRAIAHALNKNSLDARLETPDWQLADQLVGDVRQYLLGQTDVQVFERMTPEEREAAFAAPQ